MGSSHVTMPFSSSPWTVVLKTPHTIAKAGSQSLALKPGITSFLSASGQKKRGDVYKHLKLRPTVPSDMGADFDYSAYFVEETIWLYNDCETDVTKNFMEVKVQNNGCTSLCPTEED